PVRCLAARRRSPPRYTWKPLERGERRGGEPHDRVHPRQSRRRIARRVPRALPRSNMDDRLSLLDYQNQFSWNPPVKVGAMWRMATGPERAAGRGSRREPPERARLAESTGSFRLRRRPDRRSRWGRYALLASPTLRPPGRRLR